MIKLEEMLKYVSEHNNFYKNRIKEYGITNPLDITQWPVLTREELQANRYNMFSDGYKTKYYSQLLKRQFSSGTSGVPVNVYWDHNDYNNSMLALWRKRFQYYGIKPYDRVIKFTMSVYNTNFNDHRIFYYRESDNILVINRSCLQGDSNYKELIEIIHEFSPKWLYIQPFVLGNLLYYYRIFKMNPPNTIKHIESVGEILTRKLKYDAIKFFGATVANMYGSEEMNGIAYECPNNKMHILKDNVFIEIRKCRKIEQYGEGEIIITNLNNKAMPLIRYEQGDITSVTKEKSICSCESQIPTLEIIKGRVRESLNRNNRNINTYLLIEIIDEVNNSFKDIVIDYHFTYITREDLMLCYLKLHSNSSSWENIVIEKIKLSFKKKGIDDLKLSFMFDADGCNTYKKTKNVIFSIQE